MISLSRSDLDPSLVFIAFLALYAALLTLRAVRAPHRIGRPVSEEALELFGACGGAWFSTALTTGSLFAAMPLFLLCMTGAAVVRYLTMRLSMPGILWMTATAAGFAVSCLWSVLFIAEMGLPEPLRTLALAGLGLSAIVFALSQFAGFAREAVLTHERWRLPFTPPGTGEATSSVKVSLQLPCYAEPPEVVIETINRLAALDYDNYEVLVCDNNTRDERLWKPLEAHCRMLNERLGFERFRFFHVAPLPGAKAGALNFLMKHMAPDAEVIGVIDADYFARSDFLARLVPYFADREIGYIQTPHDYRGQQATTYLTACYWEYMPTNKVDYPGIHEYGGAFTIGTMCLLRTEALRKAGGWAEWCLTEDSEVSVRLRAAGYRGYYFGETFGRGLIPETFDDYKKQRFRWTAGPVQQLRRHWRLFLPAPLAPALPGWTKLLEVMRCISPLQSVIGLAMVVAGMIGLIVARMTGGMEPVHVPSIVGLLIALGAATWWVRTKHRYHLSGCTSTEDMIRGEIARASLSWVTLTAGLAGLSNKPLAWRRTPKFAGLEEAPSPFASTMPETIAGAAFTVLGLGMLALSGLLGTGLALLSFLGCAGLALRFFCAPVMAAMAIRRTRPTATVTGWTAPLPTRSQPVPALSRDPADRLRDRPAPSAGRPLVH